MSIELPTEPKKKMKVKFQKVNEVYSKIICEQSLLFELVDDFAVLVDGYKFMPAYKKGYWDGKIRYVQQNGLFYNGLLKRIWLKCKEKGYTEFEFNDYNNKKEYDEISVAEKLEEFNLPFPPYDYQLDAIQDALIKRKVILKASVSSGKSLIAYSVSRILANDGKKVLIVVPTVMLVNQLKSDFTEYSIEDENYDVDDYVHKVFAGESKWSDKPITISTYQSISALKEGKDASKLKEFMEQFDAVIVDEAHSAKANEMKLILESAINAKYRIGMTGTIDDLKSQIETLEGLLGEVKVVLTSRELIDSGRGTEIKIVPCVLKYDDEVCKDMQREIGKLYKPNQKGISKAYQYEMDSIISNSRRSEFIAKLAGKLRGNTVILTRYIENHAIPMAEIIRKHTDKTVIVLDKDTPAEMREEVRKSLEHIDDAIIIASYSLMAVGINIKNLHNLIFSFPLKSKIPILQSIGRLLRLHKSKDIAHVFDIVDDFSYNGSQTYTMKHFQSRFVFYEQEQYPVEIKQYNL